jgi:tetratricopeptide (TPR) repeat protein
MDNQKTLLIIGSCIMGFIILLGLAYYLGKQQRVNNEEALRIPIKQLTAEPGTERENAKALLSSQAKIASDTGETISQDKIWGSIENTQQEKVLTRTEQALQINMMMGIAYEQLGHPEEAKQAYTALMKQANEIGLQQHESVANVYRQAGMKLALMLQKEGKNNEAQALARTVQEAIAF